MKKMCSKNGFSYCVGGREGSSVAPPLKKIWEGARGRAPFVLVLNRHYGCIWHYLWLRRLQSAHFLPSLDDLLPKEHHESGLSKQMPTDVLSQIAIFPLDTVKITKRFACANEKRAQQTGVLLTELTRRQSNLGSGSHGRLFRPYWGCSAWYSRRSMKGGKPVYKSPFDEPPPTFRKAPPPLMFRHIKEQKFLFYGEQ